MESSKTIIPLLLGLFCLARALANPALPPVIFERITPKDGLSQSSVNYIIQDKKGFIWFATYNGLNKYDGYSFKVYQNIPNDSSSLANSSVIFLYEDNEGFIWAINNPRNGLGRFNPETENFKRYNHDPANKNSLSSNFVMHFFQDNKNNFWIVTDKAIDLYSKTKKGETIEETFYHYDISDIEGRLTRIFQNQNGNLLVFANYIYQFDPENGSLKIVSNLIEPLSASYSVTSVCEHSSGDLYIGNEQAGNIHMIFDKQTGTYTQNPNNKLNITPDDGNFLTMDHKNRIWVGTRTQGLYLFDISTKNLRHFSPQKLNPNSISDNQILSLFIDRTGILWVGTFSQGICKYDVHRKPFEHYKSNPELANSLSENVITSIHSTVPGEIWLGQVKSGVDRLIFDNTGKATIINYKHNPNNINSLGNDETFCLIQLKNKEVWASSAQGYVSVIHPNQTNGTGDPIINRYKQDPWTYTMVEDKEGTLWGGTWGNGLWRFMPETNSFFSYTHNPDDTTSICDNILWTLYEDEQGNIWIGGHGKGFSILPHNEKEKTNPAFINYINTNKPNSVNGSPINCFYKDSRGIMWIATGNGLFRTLNTEIDSAGLYRLTFASYHKKDGLPSEGIAGIVEDNHGNLWLSTSNGLSKFDFLKNEFRNYNEKDGLQSNEFWHNAYFKDFKGKLYFGGPNGLNTFYPDSIKDNPFKPEVAIVDFKLFNKSVDIGEEINGDAILTKSIGETSEIRLSHKNNVFTLIYSALHFARPEKNQYAYKMEGFDKEWNYVENKREVTYTNMDAGEYTFKVKASNYDGVWNHEGTSLKIIIIPPYWETWWFRAILIFILLSAIVSIYYIRISSLRNQKILLENTVLQRTKELSAAYDNMHNISKFGQQITATLDIVSINKMVYNYITSLTDTYAFGIGLYNRDKGQIEYNMYYEDGELITPFSRPLTTKNSFSVYSFAEQKVLFINDVQNEYQKYLPQLPGFVTATSPNSIIYIPLTVKDKKIGLLAINSVNKGAFCKNDLIKLQSLAAYIAIALDNAQIHASLVESNNALFKRQKTIEEQSEQLNETNTLLEERQQHIEEQTEELQSQAENLHNTNEELEKTNATKDKLFSIIAHDLKNPFSTVLGFSELLLKRFDNLENEKIRQMIGAIHSSSEKIYKLLENLLQWSRSQMGSIKPNPENIQVYRVIQENFDLLKNVMQQKGNKGIIEMPETLQCFADNNMFKTIVRNILTNANKFTENGTLTVKAEELKNCVKISIEDTGVGIPEDKISTLFEVEKTKSTTGTKGEQGTGLGLLICKDFVLKNNGHIDVVSGEGKGTTIIFTLPVRNHS